ncbi:MAG: hypothetical protein HRT76_13540, partial [Halieaceae bacterium]|nr:hypothetical protein [Halieaceae bacterium]
FNNDSYTLVGDAGGLLQSVADGDLYMSLHTSDPGEAGDQTTNEIVYTSYARKDVPRTAGGWTVTANAVENAAEVAMPTCTGGSATATHFGIGTDASGAGKLLYKGALGQPLAISNLIEPKFPAGTIDVTED